MIKVSKMCNRHVLLIIVQNLHLQDCHGLKSGLFKFQVNLIANFALSFPYSWLRWCRHQFCTSQAVYVQYQTTITSRRCMRSCTTVHQLCLYYQVTSKIRRLQRVLKVGGLYILLHSLNLKYRYVILQLFFTLLSQREKVNISIMYHYTKFIYLPCFSCFLYVFAELNILTLT